MCTDRVYMEGGLDLVSEVLSQCATLDALQGLPKSGTPGLVNGRILDTAKCRFSYLHESHAIPTSAIRAPAQHTWHEKLGHAGLQDHCCLVDKGQGECLSSTTGIQDASTMRSHCVQVACPSVSDRISSASIQHSPGLAEHSSYLVSLEPRRDNMASRRLSQQNAHGAVAHARSYDAGCQTACYHRADTSRYVRSKEAAFLQATVGRRTSSDTLCHTQGGKNRRIRSLSLLIMGRGSQGQQLQKVTYRRSTSVTAQH
jgi:hypothetical protein